MKLAEAIVTQNKSTQKTLDQINKNISVLVTMQKKEEQKNALMLRRKNQAAKRAEADRKRDERLNAIAGSKDEKKRKIDGGGLLKTLGLVGAGAAIVAYFKSEKFRKFVNEKIFAPIGDFFKTKLGELGEAIKQFALDLPEKLFGKKGLFGEENRQRLMEGLFGKKGLFGQENRDALHKFLFASDGIFGKKNRDAVYESLLGDKGIFSPKNVSDAYKSFKSFFVDDADWKKSVRDGTYKFFVEDAEWKQNIRKGFEIVVQDFTNLMGDLGNALKNWIVNNVPGVKQVTNAYQGFTTAVQSGIDSTKNTFGFAADSDRTRQAIQSVSDSRNEAVLRGLNPLTTDSEKNVLQMQTDEREKILEISKEIDQKKFDLEKIERRLDSKTYRRPTVRKRDEAKAQELREEIELLEKKYKIYSDNPIGLQKGGRVQKVPGSGSGDKVPAMLKPGSFVLNREASKFLYRQEGGPVPTMLEPGELVFPKSTQALEDLNEKVPRFQKKAVTPRPGDGAPSEQANTALAFASQGVQFRQKGGKIYLHWVASGYNYKDTAHYHKIVQGDGSIFDANPISNYKTRKGHTWGRNSTGVGISAAAMAGGVPQGPWPTPPKPAQITGMGQAIAQVAKEWGWGPSQINASNVMTHSEAAYKDGYGLGSGDPQTKWDFDRVSLSDAPKTGGNKLRAAAKEAMGGGGGGEQNSGSGAYAFPLPGGVIGTDAGQLFGAPRPGGRLHAGIDIVERPFDPASDPRIPVVATKDGKVLDERYLTSSDNAGLMISQGDGYDTRYVHMTPLKKPGEIVKAGEQIGKLVSLGQGGGSTHLHYELYKNNSTNALDPTKYLTSQGATSPSGQTIAGKGSMPDGPGGELGGPLDGILGGGLLSGLAIGGAALLGASALGDAAPILAAFGVGAMLEGMIGDIAGAFSGLGDFLQGGVDMLSGGGDQAGGGEGENTDAGTDKGSTVSATGPGGGDVQSIISGMGFDKKGWDIYANTVGKIESGNKYDPVPVGKGGGSGGMYDGRWQLGRMAKTDAAAKLGVADPGHGPSGAANRKAFIADTDMQDKFFAAYTAKNYEYMSSDSLFNALPQKEKWAILGYAHNIGHAKAKEFLRTGVSGADGAGTKSVTFSNALKKNFTAAGYQTGGLVSTMLEPGETVGNVEAFNDAIPRFGGGSNSISGTITPNSQNFYQKTMEMDAPNNPVVVMMNQLSGGGKGMNATASHPSNPAPSLSNGPSMAALSDIINRVSWSSVF